MKLGVPALVTPASRVPRAEREEHERQAAETVELLDEIDSLLAELSRHPCIARKQASPAVARV
jgi:hypothetical protein